MQDRSTYRCLVCDERGFQIFYLSPVRRPSSHETNPVESLTNNNDSDWARQSKKARNYVTPGTPGTLFARRCGLITTMCLQVQKALTCKVCVTNGLQPSFGVNQQAHQQELAPFYWSTTLPINTIDHTPWESDKSQRTGMFCESCNCSKSKYI